MNFLSNNHLTQLPPDIDNQVHSFDCSHNLLTDLVGSPKSIGGDFNCSNNKLTSLLGGPITVNGEFDCKNNMLSTLEYSPDFCKHFESNNNKLSSLYGVSKNIKEHLFLLKNNILKDVSDIWESNIGGIIFIDFNNDMAVLPLIKFVVVMNNRIVDTLILQNRGDSKQNILDLQYKLMEKGFEENARWRPL